MKQKIRNYTQYKIELRTFDEKKELLTTESLQVAAIRLREYALKYAQFMRYQRELNNSAWLTLYVVNITEEHPALRVICRIGAVEDMDDLCMI